MQHVFMLLIYRSAIRDNVPTKQQEIYVNVYSIIIINGVLNKRPTTVKQMYVRNFTTFYNMHILCDKINSCLFFILLKHIFTIIQSASTLLLNRFLILLLILWNLCSVSILLLHEKQKQKITSISTHPVNCNSLFLLKKNFTMWET